MTKLLTRTSSGISRGASSSQSSGLVASGSGILATSTQSAGFLSSGSSISSSGWKGGVKSSVKLADFFSSPSMRMRTCRGAVGLKFSGEEISKLCLQCALMGITYNYKQQKKERFTVYRSCATAPKGPMNIVSASEGMGFRHFSWQTADAMLLAAIFRSNVLSPFPISFYKRSLNLQLPGNASGTKNLLNGSKSDFQGLSGLRQLRAMALSQMAQQSAELDDLREEELRNSGVNKHGPCHHRRGNAAQGTSYNWSL